MAQKYYGVISINISLRAVDFLNDNQCITVPEQKLADGLLWNLQVKKAATSYKDNTTWLNVCIWVSEGFFRATGELSWGGRCPGVKKISDFPVGYNEDIRIPWPTSCKGNFDMPIRCEITLTRIYMGIKLPSPNVDELCEDATHFEPDVAIVVGGERLKVHRSMLSLMSPVFHSYFVHDSLESKTGVIKITDFKCKTVKNVIDFAYGRVIKEQEVTEVIDMLRFADKYDIKTVLKHEVVLETNLNMRTFSTVAQYAWSFDKKELQKQCAEFFRGNVQTLTLSPAFVQLAPEVQCAIIRSAAPESV